MTAPQACARPGRVIGRVACGGNMGGTTIGSMKIAISVPDPIFKAADTLARRLKKSRSQLYSEAVAAYLGAVGANAVREKLDAVYAHRDSTPDPVLTQLSLQTVDPDETW